MFRYIFLMLYITTIYSQKSFELTLPKEPNGVVMCNISTFMLNDVKRNSYSYLAVYLENNKENQPPIPIQGNYIIQGNYLFFTPYLPYEKGMIYTAKIRLANTNKGYWYKSFQVGKKQIHVQPKVLTIYPSANILPENLLRFYVYFNTPMKKGEAFKHIQLVDSKGNIDTNAFMQFKEELWSNDGKRLTVLFDPGRIKRGVSTNIKLGSALQKGKHYQLIISEKWKDVYNQNLSKKFIKQFTVQEAYRQEIDSYKWVIVKPKVTTYNPLIIHFDRIMDYALSKSMIQIISQNNTKVFGKWEVLENEKMLQFIPEKKWQKGNYHIVIDPILEDVCGNNLNSLLDVKEGSKSTSNKALLLGFKL